MTINNTKIVNLNIKKEERILGLMESWGVSQETAELMDLRNRKMKLNCSKKLKREKEISDERTNIGNVFVSTDSIKIANISKKNGAKILGLRPKKIIFGDGILGLADDAPFDRILVTAGASQVPKNLLDQLKIGGKLVIPVGLKEQEMLRFTRIAKKEFNKESFGKFRFVPLLNDKN